MMTNRVFFLVLIATVCFACGGSTSEKTLSEEHSSKDAEAVFRQVSFGMKASEIRDTETAKLERSTSDALFYSTNIGEGGFADITYHLNSTSRRLQKIEFDVFIKNADDAQSVYNGLKQQFNRDYDSGSTSGYWLGNDGVNNFEVMLRQSVSKTTPGLYAVWEKL